MTKPIDNYSFTQQRDLYLKGLLMDALNQYTFVAPTEDELMVEQPDAIFVSLDSTIFEDEVIILNRS